MTSQAAGKSHDMTGLIVRWFGWSMIGILGVYMLNSVLTLSHGWPGVSKVFSGGGFLAILQLAFYVAVAAGAWFYVTRRSDLGLREDAKKITSFNIYLVRAGFFAVLFIGLADMFISFLRVEGMLESVFGTELAKDLGRSAFRGPWVHYPLAVLALLIAIRARTLGFPWLALLIVVAELAIVFTRFIFSYEQAFMGDLVRFWYAALFLFASAYTLLEEGHVRVDVFYAGMSKRKRGMVNAVGTLFLGFAMCWTIMLMGMGNKQSIIYAPLANFEVSQSGFGMYTKYLMAGFLGFFAVTMLIQFASYLMEAVADWRDEPGGRKVEAPAAH